MKSVSVIRKFSLIKLISLNALLDISTNSPPRSLGTLITQIRTKAAALAAQKNLALMRISAIAQSAHENTYDSLSQHFSFLLQLRYETRT